MVIVGKNLQLRPMTQEDIPFAMKLKSMANWNQLESDWRLLVKADLGGNFIAVYNNQYAGTVTTIAYNAQFSWIGMVLVDPGIRGLGIGSALLNAAIAFAKRNGAIRLDATPKGKKLYETLGFKTERNLVRFERKSAKHLPAPIQKCNSFSAESFKKVLEADPLVFGADRKMVLSFLLDTAPQYAHYLEKDGVISGYCFGRSGCDFEHIGPIIAQNQADARDLLLSALLTCQSVPVILDVFEENSQWLEELESLEFKIQRPFIRMYLGELKNAGQIGLQYAIAGPELG